MSKKTQREELRAVKAVETILEYCKDKDSCCEGCVFRNFDTHKCTLSVPTNWDVEKTIKFYKEVNE